MTALVLQLPAAGYTALVNPANTGTNAILVAEIGVTATAFTANSGMTALPGEIKRITTFSGLVVADDTIHVTISDSTADTYSLRGFCLYDDDGVVLALYGQAGVILEKSTQAVMLLSADVKFSNPIEAEIVFGDITFANPPASATVPGVTQYASNSEALTGTSTDRSIVASALKYVLDSRFGAGAPTAFVKGLLNLATAALFRTALEIKSAALKDEGAGNSLDADLLDGQHGAYYLNYNNLTNKPAVAIAATEKGAPNGVATLDGGGKIPAAQLPLLALADVFVVASQAAQLALTAQEGDVAVRSDINRSYIHNGGAAGTMADWQELLTPTDAVLSVAGRTGAIVLAIADITGLQAVLDAKAALASPALTGTPTCPTAAPGTNTTQLASTAFVQAAITAALANYLPKNNPTFTGVMTGPSYNKAP